MSDPTDRTHCLMVCLETARQAKERWTGQLARVSDLRRDGSAGDAEALVFAIERVGFARRAYDETRADLAECLGWSA